MTVDEGRRITITAIAREAGVSVPTVSRVVNGRSDVSPRPGRGSRSCCGGTATAAGWLAPEPEPA